MPEGKICNECGAIHPGTGARCSTCDVPRPRNRRLSYRQQETLERKVYRSAKWRQARALALERDGARCVRCSTPDDLVVHHHVEISEGIDPYDLDNLETLCRPCHGREHATRRRARADIQ